jgi:hypothetical protein
LNGDTIPRGYVPGANPTIVIYNASAVKIYNATTNSPKLFENKIIFLYILSKNALAYYTQNYNSTTMNLLRSITKSGCNPTTVSYNARVVKIYYAKSSLVHSENKNIFSTLKKCSSLLQLWRCGCKFNSRRIAVG